MRVADGTGGAFVGSAVGSSLMFALGASPGFSVGDGEAATFTIALVFWFVLPPVGIPVSPAPVAGDAASTGWLFGSAVSSEPAVVGVGG